MPSPMIFSFFHTPEIGRGLGPETGTGTGIGTGGRETAPIATGIAAAGNEMRRGVIVFRIEVPWFVFVSCILMCEYVEHCLSVLVLVRRNG